MPASISARRKAQKAGFFVRRRLVNDAWLWFVEDGPKTPPELSARGFALEKDAWIAAAGEVEREEREGARQP